MTETKTPDPRDSMTPEQRAQQDYKDTGAGQDANPYCRRTQRELWDRYAWAMHCVWNEAFKADQQQIRNHGETL